jgi:hypothetical protein
MLSAESSGPLASAKADNRYNKVRKTSGFSKHHITLKQGTSMLSGCILSGQLELRGGLDASDK